MSPSYSDSTSLNMLGRVVGSACTLYLPLQCKRGCEAMHVGLIKWSMPLPALQASSFSSVAHCHLPNNLVIGHNLCKHNNILCLFVGGSRRIPTTQTAIFPFMVVTVSTAFSGPKKPPLLAVDGVGLRPHTAVRNLGRTLTRNLRV